MVSRTVKVLQQMIQIFQRASEHFGKLCMTGLKILLHPEKNFPFSKIYQYFELLLNLERV